MVTMTQPRRQVSAASWSPATSIGLGSSLIFLSLVVLIPLAAVIWTASGRGVSGFMAAITAPDAVSAVLLTIGVALLTTAINAVMGTILAWVLVRDDFPGKSIMNGLVDLPLVLPTIVAGLVLVELYGTQSPLGINMAYSRWGVGLALLFTTMPYVVRTVQPVLAELDREVEQAGACLGASPRIIFWRIILPHMTPAMLSGAGLAFTRAIAEFGAVVLISGNIPGQTQVASVYIFSQIESDNTAAAAAVSTVLLVVALIALSLLTLTQRWVARRG
jgi:sulfate/thiosulfate transport system permease protein